MPLAAAAEDFEFSALSEARNYRHALIREFGSYLHDDVLEAGSGVGQMTAELAALPAIRRLIAMEPEARYCERIRRMVPRAEVVHGTAQTLPAETHVDAILSTNVLEHIEHDAAELKLYAEMLRKRRGHLCLFVPARTELYAPIDKDFGHWRRYTRPDLTAKLRAAGFGRIQMRYYNLAGYFGWLLKFRWKGERRMNVADVRLFDRWIFPSVNWIERTLFAPPVGQSLLAVAQAG
jgi:SAM-dependent methyltransferase